MVRKTSRRGKRILVIDFTYTKSDGTEARYRRDAAVQIMAAAQTEEEGRKLGATMYGDPEVIVGRNGVPLRPTKPEIKPPPELTFAEVVARYHVEYAPVRLEPSTRAGYESKLRTWILPRLGSLPVSAVTAKVLRDLDTAMVQAEASDTMRRSVFVALGSVLLLFAVEAEIIKGAPQLPKLPKIGERIVEVPIPDDFARVVDGAQYPEYKVAFLLGGHAGLRRSEVRGLRCRDCDFEGQGRIIVRFQKYKGDLSRTKSGSDRQIPMTPALRRALLAVGADRRPKDSHVALNTRGKPWGTTGIWEVFIATLKRAKLDRCRFHALRHFFVTALFRGGVSAPVVQKLAGHADLATTQRYAQVHGTDRAEAIGALEASYKMPLALPSGRRSPRPKATRRVTKGRGGVLRARTLARASARTRGNS